MQDSKIFHQSFVQYRSPLLCLLFQVIPAHRVVNRNGMLTGKVHFATPTQMQELLEKEGTKVEKDTVVDFEKRFWDPAKELGL